MNNWSKVICLFSIIQHSYRIWPLWACPPLLPWSKLLPSIFYPVCVVATQLIILLCIPTSQLLHSSLSKSSVLNFWFIIPLLLFVILPYVFVSYVCCLVVNVYKFYAYIHLWPPFLFPRFIHVVVCNCNHSFAYSIPVYNYTSVF